MRRDPDLEDLQVPRHVHQADGVSRIVQTLDDLRAAVAEGWQLRPFVTPPEAEPPVPTAANIDAEDAARRAAFTDASDPPMKRRKR